MSRRRRHTKASASSCNTTTDGVASDDEDLSDAIPAAEERMIFNYLAGYCLGVRANR